MAAELGSVIQLQSEVLSVHWSQTGGADVIYQEDLTKTTEHFDSVIVTVPLGVLKEGSIDFQPPLPPYKLASIDKLGYGNLNKVVLTFPEVFWGDTDFFGIAQPAPGPRGLGYIFWNIAKAVKKPVLVALLAGQAANEAEKGGHDDVIIDRIMENLRAVFGDKVGEPHSAHVTHWGTDPYARGCYSYVGVAASGLDYDLLARPVGDVLFFAGEATNRRHPSTVAGAIESGIREAARIDRLFGASADTERFTEPEFAQQVRSTHAMIPFARSGRNQEPEPEPVPEEKNNEDGEEPKAKRQKIDEEGEQPEPAKSPKLSEGLLLFECDACRLYLPSAAALRSHQDQSHPANTVG